jgi:secondary thiamine-phosphate synthase enzyme
MVKTDRINLKTRGNNDIVDITPEVSRALSDSQLKNGILTAFMPGSTASITTIEYEPGLVKEDLPKALEAMAPSGSRYAHDSAWGEGNGHAHVRASIVGPGLTVPFSEGRLMLGTWQQIVLVDYDNRARSREVIVQIVGE